MEKYICIHGHFYQPPRENPWLEEVEYQDSAYPYHDWNERITAECYAPNTASRIISSDGRVLVIGNNYARISFDFGPTLLSWLERHAADIYASILDADLLSRRRFSGHGSAMAQAYNHLILPLANQRDRETQITWGIKDFEKRFQRYPEGMWLPETAVNTDTLEILALKGIKFTVLSPYQAKATRRMGEENWTDATGGRLDPRVPYLYRLPSGRSIALFFYDGPVSRDIAFGGLLNRGEVFAGRLLSTFTSNGEAQLVHVATDGETFGHHHQYGDMALAYCLSFIENNKMAVVTNYGEYLEKHPPVYEAQIYENSSWSCFHGVERWRNDCGCSTGTHPGWNQKWRKPLKEALDWLRDALQPIFEKEGGRYFTAPWQARDEYITVILDRSPENIARFLKEQSGRELSEDESVRAVKLLEMQRNGMLMYTSCGWFFDEVSGIETVQILQYACRAIQLAEELTATPLEPAFLKYLELVPTNIPEFIHGAKIYSLFVKPAKVDFLRVGAHYTISSLFEDTPRKMAIYCYNADTDIYDRRIIGKSQLFICRTVLTSRITLEKARLSGAVLHLGDQNLNCGVRYYVSDAASDKTHNDIAAAFERGNVLEVVKLMERDFGTHNFTLSSLFKDEQQRMLNRIIQPTLDQVNVALEEVCDHNCTIIDFFSRLNIPVPREMLTILGYRANVEMLNSFNDGIDLERLRRSVNDICRWNLDIDRPRISLIASQWVARAMEQLSRDSSDTFLLERIVAVLRLMTTVKVPLNLWKSQNIFYYLDRELSAAQHLKSSIGVRSDEWMSAFHALGAQLNIREAQ